VKAMLRLFIQVILVNRHLYPLFYDRVNLLSVNQNTLCLRKNSPTLDQEDTDVYQSGCRILPTQSHMGTGDSQVTCSIKL